MSLPRPHEDVVFQRVGDDLVLVQLKTNEIYALNETGARLWELLGAGKSRTEVEGAMLRDFDVSPEQLAVELDRILAELTKHKMLRDG